MRRSVNAELAIPTIAGYNASKGGVSNLTRCMVLAAGRAAFALHSSDARVCRRLRSRRTESASTQLGRAA